MNRMDNLKSSHLESALSVEVVSKPKRKQSASPRPPDRGYAARGSTPQREDLRDQNEQLKMKLELALAELDQSNKQLKE
jgi:hypothetical protein